MKLSFKKEKDFKLIRDLILKQDLRESEKIIYIKILEDFFDLEEIKINNLYKSNLKEDEILFELTLKFLNFSKKSANMSLYSKSDSTNLSSNKTQSVYYDFNSKSISSFSNIYFNKFSDLITIDKFDPIKANVKFINENSILEKENKKILTLDKLLDEYYYNSL